MEDWSATHCSEACLLYDIRHSESYHDHSNIDELLAKMKTQNRFDIRMLNDLK